MHGRGALPKSNQYSFGLSASREQVSKTYNPNDNSPRAKDSMAIPGPGQYKYKNFNVGTGGRHFSFLKRTKNSLGKFQQNSLSVLGQRKDRVVSFSLILLFFRISEFNFSH